MLAKILLLRRTSSMESSRVCRLFQMKRKKLLIRLSRKLETSSMNLSQLITTKTTTLSSASGENQEWLRSMKHQVQLITIRFSTCSKALIKREARRSLDTEDISLRITELSWFKPSRHLDNNSLWKKDTPLCTLHSSCLRMSWVRHANCLTSMINSTRLMVPVLLTLKNKRLKMKIERNTLSLLQNSQFLLTTLTNGSNLRISLSVTLVCHLASEKKQVLLEEKPGVFTESTNSKKSNNSFLLSLKTLGKNSREWSVFPRNSCRLLVYLTESSTLSPVPWTMLLQRNTIWKHGSLVMVNTRN